MRRSEAKKKDQGSHEKAIPSGPAWYPLQTRYQCEKKVDAALRDQGFESFAPMQLELRRWSDRAKLVESPLFPGYTFVRMEPEPESLVKVLRVPGLVRFVTTGRELVAVPNAEIETVRSLVESKARCEPGPFPVVGEKVRIRGGCLEGVEGILTAQTEKGEIVVSIGAIQRSLKVPLGGYRIERLGYTEQLPPEWSRSCEHQKHTSAAGSRELHT
jgi:transcription antitermination factor NusG